MEKTQCFGTLIKHKVLDKKKGVQRILVCWGKNSTVIVLVDNTYKAPKGMKLRREIIQFMYSRYGATLVKSGGKSAKSRLKKLNITGKRARGAALKNANLNICNLHGFTQEEITQILDYRVGGIQIPITRCQISNILFFFERKFAVECLTSHAEVAIDAIRMAKTLGFNEKFSCGPIAAHEKMLEEIHKIRIQEMKDVSLPANEWVIDALEPVWDGTVKTPRTAKEINEWGLSQNHCVGSYTGDVIKGSSVIFGLFDSNDNHVYTGEWSYGSLVQLKGKHNKEADRSVFNLVHETLVGSEHFS